MRQCKNLWVKEGRGLIFGTAQTHARMNKCNVSVMMVASLSEEVTMSVMKMIL